MVVKAAAEQPEKLRAQGFDEDPRCGRKSTPTTASEIVPDERPDEARSRLRA